MAKKEDYVPVRIEAVNPDGSVGVINSFWHENSAVRGGDPDWPRERLIAVATTAMIRWSETYFDRHTNIKLRLAK